MYKRHIFVVTAAFLAVVGTSVPVAAATSSDGPQDPSAVVGDPLAAPLEKPLVQPSAAAALSLASAVPQFTFTIDASWSQNDRSVLQAWTAANSAELAAVAQVAGPPGQSTTINVVYAPTSPYAGEYDPNTHTVLMGSLDLGVFVHELNHAVHGPWIINNAVWEEGMARASEVAEMNILAARGISAAKSYFDLHHGYSYDEYYDNSNVSDVGVSGGSIWGLGDPALALFRYEQSGYAFGKIFIETPAALKMFNAKLFAQPSGNLSVSALEGMMTAVKPKVEGTASSTWFAQQQIFNSTPPAGCVLFQRSSQYSVDLFSRSSDGLETPLSSSVTLQVYNYAGQLLWSSTGSTSPGYGVASFYPQLGAYNGAIKLVTSAVAPCGTVHSTYYRQSGIENGVFGVVRHAATGTVTFTSPSKAFASFSVPVINAAFAAPSLTAVAGKVTLSFSGAGKTASRVITKDASNYSVVLKAN
jgi:hypothetical protein